MAHQGEIAHRGVSAVEQQRRLVLMAEQAIAPPAAQRAWHHALHEREGAVPDSALVGRGRGLAARDGTPARAQAVAGTVPSGGRVFASGTFWWAWGLEARYAAAHGVPAGFATLTANILSILAGP